MKFYFKQSPFLQRINILRTLLVPQPQFIPRFCNPNTNPRRLTTLESGGWRDRVSKRKSGRDMRGHAVSISVWFFKFWIVTTKVANREKYSEWTLFQILLNCEFKHLWLNSLQFKSILDYRTVLPHCGSRDATRQRNTFDADHWTLELYNAAAQRWTLTCRSL